MKKINICGHPYNTEASFYRAWHEDLRNSFLILRLASNTAIDKHHCVPMAFQQIVRHVSGPKSRSFCSKILTMVARRTSDCNGRRAGIVSQKDSPRRVTRVLYHACTPDAPLCAYGVLTSE